MSNKFQYRLGKGATLYNGLIDFLNSNGIAYFLTGYERLDSANNANGNIIKNNTHTSLFVRHYPDITICSKKETYLVEVKNSTGIEKECWDTYLSLNKKLGLKVLLYLKDERIYPIQNVEFKKAKPYCYASGLMIPIVDEIWRSPRLMPESDYNKYMKANKGRTSGCSFAFIDFDRSIGFDKKELLRLKSR